MSICLSMVLTFSLALPVCAEPSDGSEKMKPIVNEVTVKTVITKSNLPVGDYSVNPYIGCTHA